VALLASEAFHFGHSHAFHADLREGVFHFFQLKWFDNGFDFLHVSFVGLMSQGWSGWLLPRPVFSGNRRGEATPVLY
jgi:hypothetical protein